MFVISTDLIDWLLKKKSTENSYLMRLALILKYHKEKSITHRVKYTQKCHTTDVSI